jgi:nucleoid-associated protein YgaU
MSISTGLKKKLSIAPCNVNAGTITVDSSQAPFEAMINPAGYKRQLKIDYSKKKTLGQPSAESKFSAICPEVLTLQDLVLDGTGVVALVGAQSVQDMVEQLLGVVYAYKGDKHEPNHVRLLWGTFIFFGRVESISIDYTLFKPSGEPLRARIAMSFVGWMSSEEGSLRANTSSPDLSHLVEVKLGDTLPLLCNRIYKDSSYYREVARINNLTNFRNLEPGLVLRFPPLV